MIVGFFAALVLGAGVLPGSDAEAKTRIGANDSVVDDPSNHGEWIADVERPAERYRGKYQIGL